MAFGRKPESQHSANDHDEFSKSEKGVVANSEALDAEDIPWTFKRVVAIISLCLVYVGSQVILYFISAGLTPISKDLNTSIGNWMITANVSASTRQSPLVYTFANRFIADSRSNVTLPIRRLYDRSPW